ncbi:MAG: hypothetical protein QNK37_20475 [Acidobacteriota bacterium]|nr:hypothetical protein [Acidobacteriota bacterium]
MLILIFLFLTTGSMVDPLTLHFTDQLPDPVTYRFDVREMVTDGQTLVALDENAVVLVSTDGMHWQQVPGVIIGYNRPAEDVLAWTGEAFVIIDRNRQWVSTDGYDWQTRAMPDEISFPVWDGARFVREDTQNQVLYISPDGETWSAHQEYTTPPHRVATNGAGFLGIRYGDVLVSDDGLTWREVIQFLYPNFDQLIWTGEVFLTTFTNYERDIGNPGRGQTVIYSSGSGTVWQEVHRTNASTSSLALMNGTVVVGATHNTGVLTSADGGQTWEHIESAIPGNVVRRFGDRFVAVGDDGRTAVSDNGFDWTPGHMTTRVPVIYDAARGDKGWVAVGENGNLLHSRDGRNWREGVYVDLPRYSRMDYLVPRMDISKVLWTGAEYLAVGTIVPANPHGTYFELIVCRSTDGLNWTATTPGFAGERGHGMAWDGEKVTAYLEHGDWFTSPNGKEWTKTEQKHIAQAFGGSVVIFTDFTGNYMVKDLGLPDLEPQALPLEGILSVAWSGSRFAAIIEDQIVYTSFDGLQWDESGPLHADGSQGKPENYLAGGNGGFFTYHRSSITDDLRFSIDGVDWMVLKKDFHALNRLYADGDFILAVDRNHRVLMGGIQETADAFFPRVLDLPTQTARIDLVNPNDAALFVRLEAVGKQSRRSQIVELEAGEIQTLDTTALFGKMFGYALYVYASGRPVEVTVTRELEPDRVETLSALTPADASSTFSSTTSSEDDAVVLISPVAAEGHRTHIEITADLDDESTFRKEILLNGREPGLVLFSGLTPAPRVRSITATTLGGEPIAGRIVKRSPVNLPRKKDR